MLWWVCRLTEQTSPAEQASIPTMSEEEEEEKKRREGSETRMNERLEEMKLKVTENEAYCWNDHFVHTQCIVVPILHNFDEVLRRNKGEKGEKEEIEEKKEEIEEKGRRLRRRRRKRRKINWTHNMRHTELTATVCTSWWAWYVTGLFSFNNFRASSSISYRHTQWWTLIRWKVKCLWMFVQHFQING